MWVKVKIDVTKPLCRGRKIGLSNGEESWVSFKYERMPNLCYWCRRLTHYDKECSTWLKRKGTLRKNDQQFGSWLRANTPNLAKKTIIYVTGYEEEVREDNEAILNQERSDEGGTKVLNEMQSNSDREQKRFVDYDRQIANSDDQYVKVAAQVAPEVAVTLEESSLAISMEPAQIKGLASHNFQA